mmetsp:Transcript_42149/g.47089  ORF Transcript_42149/g.47089 Transcript_42149/m.47089 type:complete len:88 (+) Transcript_42149:557-820(+)|eukprot:CAMPEP_0170895152 /NCGR_PEP_ID=MMETSP0734-20130129/43728_1 /TAXON_ID=186038 /ORGANISM="Fragilariopsis kerguelensis, Strain L26-C5" /LENGTH=87 /DNA_ID=CAMNT_0011286547 /DNA_START=552 /DNA_END=815 /DNA_ORIENTATION=+
MAATSTLLAQFTNMRPESVKHAQVSIDWSEYGYSTTTIGSALEKRDTTLCGSTLLLPMPKHQCSQHIVVDDTHSSGSLVGLILREEK